MTLRQSPSTLSCLQLPKWCSQVHPSLLSRLFFCLLLLLIPFIIAAELSLLTQNTLRREKLPFFLFVDLIMIRSSSNFLLAAANRRIGYKIIVQKFIYYRKHFVSEVCNFFYYLCFKNPRFKGI